MNRQVFLDRSWYSEAGPDDDVVISTRVRLARNLAGLSFPDRMNESELTELRIRIVPLIADVLAKPLFRHIDIATARSDELTFLIERNLYPRDMSGRSPLMLCVRNDQKITALVNGIDHIHVTGFRTGLRAQEALAEVRGIEEQLDTVLRFAVDMNFGFLTSEISSCGTGMRCGTLVHLPGLTESDSLQNVFTKVQASGFRVKRFASSTDDSLGSVYQISDGGQFGKSEETVIRELEAVVGEVVQSERESRVARLEQDGSLFRSQVYEAQRMLQTVQTLDTEAALKTVLWLRAGAATGLIEGTNVEDFTSLLFEVQKNHILRVMESAKSGGSGSSGGVSGITDSMVAAHRADMVRRVL